MITRTRIVSGALALVVFAALCSAAITTVAAQGPGRAGRGMPPGRGQGPGVLPGIQRLDLTDAQREQVRAIVADQTTPGAGRKALDTLQHQLTAAVMADTPDLGQIEQIKAAIAEAEVAALNQRVELQLKVAQILTPEQRQKARELPAGPPRPGGRGRALHH